MQEFASRRGAEPQSFGWTDGLEKQKSIFGISIGRSSV